MLRCKEAHALSHPVSLWVGLTGPRSFRTTDVSLLLETENVSLHNVILVTFCFYTQSEGSVSSFTSPLEESGRRLPSTSANLSCMSNDGEYFKSDLDFVAPVYLRFYYCQGSSSATVSQCLSWKETFF